MDLNNRAAAADISLLLISRPVVLIAGHPPLLAFHLQTSVQIVELCKRLMPGTHLHAASQGVGSLIWVTHGEKAAG